MVHNMCMAETPHLTTHYIHVTYNILCVCVLSERLSEGFNNTGDGEDRWEGGVGF